MEQAAHVRAGRFDALDRENLAEEINPWDANNSTSSKACCASC
jgi:hypothetical protein